MLTSKHLNIFWGGRGDTGKTWEISGQYRKLKEIPKKTPGNPGKFF